MAASPVLQSPLFQNENFLGNSWIFFSFFSFLCFPGFKIYIIYLGGYLFLWWVYFLECKEIGVFNLT